MSFYATVGGEIIYDNKHEHGFDKAFRLLRESGHIDADGYFLDEIRNRITQPPLDEQPDLIETDKICVLTIPIFHYRNLTRLLDLPEIVQGAKGRIVWTSTDGCFQGGILHYENGVRDEVFDLGKWAEENGFGEEPQEKDSENKEDYWEDLSDWQQYVEQEFFEENLP